MPLQNYFRFGCFALCWTISSFNGAGYTVFGTMRFNTVRIMNRQCHSAVISLVKSAILTLIMAAC